MKLKSMTLGPSERQAVQEEIVARVSGGQQLIASYGVDAPAAKQTQKNGYTP